MADIKNNNNRFISVLLLVLGISFLSGCATTSSKPNPKDSFSENNFSETSETLLQVSNNHTALIALYKQQLQNSADQKTKAESRLKLGQAYLDAGDPESTLFYIEPLFIEPLFTRNAQPDAELILLKSRAYFALGSLDDALKTALIAQDLDNSNPQIDNHLGLVYASTGNLSEARDFFMQARAGLLDDLTVKNNLAMLDILENNYVSAVKRLMPLYTSGQADERVKANLIFAMIKGGMYNEFQTIYTEADTEAERVALFRLLSEVTPYIRDKTGAPNP